MRRLSACTLVLVAALVPAAACAQNTGDAARRVSGGGVSVPGWTGAVDPGSGESVSAALLAREGNALHVVTGPAVAFWNPADKASGDYTVKATFREPAYMNRNDHPHPYGVFIGGNDMTTDKRSYLYCAAYGNGRFIVRGFGPAAFQLNGRGGESSPAVHRASAAGQPVTQDVALSVKGDNVQCAINGTVVATYPKSQVVGPGKLNSTDGIYGIRFAHNTEGFVTALAVTKP